MVVLSCFSDLESECSSNGCGLRRTFPVAVAKSVAALDFHHVTYRDNQLRNGLDDLPITEIGTVQHFESWLDEALSIINCGSTQVHQVKFRTVIARVDIVGVKIMPAIHARLQADISISSGVVNVEAKTNHLTFVIVFVIDAGFQICSPTSVP